MAKFFVVSDIHSYFNIFINELKEKGFDEYNNDHWLIVCGDCFDRGPESEDLLHYLMTLERKVIVKGNHDILLEECCLRGFPYSHDKHNGTTKTIQDISKLYSAYDFAEACVRTLNKTARYRELLVNYFETQNYIFVHSWIPTNVEYEGKLKPWYQEGKTLTYMEDWRNANDVEWEEAMWGNPFARYCEGLNQTGKTIVFGHWHCSTGHRMLGNCNDEFEDAIWDPFYGDNIIGVDRCTAYTKQCNVIVIEDEFLEENV